jgi:hypothetical protein|tara:strand:- start:164 stop:388 length:225 start_codon:yes stop_codon:yes gene_type:complete
MKNVNLTDRQKDELNRLVVAITEEAISVKMDYEQSGSNLDSGSMVVVHQNSSLLDNDKEKLSDVAYNITKKVGK